MRTLALGIMGWLLAGLSGSAQAESIYRYYDPHSRRDVFVNRLEQVPAPFRGQAKPVVADGVLVGVSNPSDVDVRPGTVIFGGKQPAGAMEALKQAFNSSNDGSGTGKFVRLVITLMDTGLVKAGKLPLAAAHVLQVTYMAGIAALALAVASLLAIVAWIFVLVHAFRDDHPAWGVFLLLLPPLGLVYVLIHVESKQCWFKLATLLGQFAPFLVIAIAIWRFYVYFANIMAGRGAG